MMGRRERIGLQMDAVMYINAARKLYSLSFKQLSKILEIPESTLCRYANMEVLPSMEAAGDIINRLSQMIDIRSVVSRLIKVSNGYIDLTPIVFEPMVLKLYEKHIRELFSGFRITKVVTAAVDGVPLAVAASYALNAKLTIAKQYMDAGFDQYYEASYIADSPPRKVNLYVPKPMLSREDSILLIDDIVRTGRTLDALLSIIKQSDASLAGVSILVAANEDVVRSIRSKVGNIVLDIIHIIGKL